MKNTKNAKESFRKNADLYKVMGNPKRLEILDAISSKEKTVNELSNILGTRKSNTSQHLAYLRYVGLVIARRDGKNVFYKIADPRLMEPCKIFNEIRAKRSLNKSAQLI